jgi:hypothetical protein
VDDRADDASYVAQIRTLLDDSVAAAPMNFSSTIKTHEHYRPCFVLQAIALALIGAVADAAGGRHSAATPAGYAASAAAATPRPPRRRQPGHHAGSGDSAADARHARQRALPAAALPLRPMPPVPARSINRSRI